MSQKNDILDARIEKGKVPDIYRKVASTYDLWGILTESKGRNRCLELAAIKDGEAVLEVAVGTGLAFEKILKANPNGRNEGVDLTEEMLSHAKKKAELSGINSYHLRVGDAYDLGYPDESFDVLINNYMFDLIPERDFHFLLKEFKRVLRSGGRLVMVNMTKAVHWYNALWEVIYRINPSWLGGCRGVVLLPYLKSVGFKETRREFISQLTFPSEVVYGVKGSVKSFMKSPDRK